MAPILPGISDSPEQLERVVRAAREAGATNVWANVLYLKPGTREHFLEALAADWPEELDRYERLYESRAYLPKAQVEPVRRMVAELRKRHGIRDHHLGVRQAPARDRRHAGALIERDHFALKMAREEAGFRRRRAPSSTCFA